MLGFPLTESYSEGDVLTQDFQRLELQMRGGKVVVAALGIEYYSHEGLYAEAPKTPSIPPDFMAYMRAHGGTAVFGSPLSRLLTAENGDGSQRQYQMRYFANARLERHPEAPDARYRNRLACLALRCSATVPGCDKPRR